MGSSIQTARRPRGMAAARTSPTKKCTSRQHSPCHQHVPSLTPHVSRHVRDFRVSRLPSLTSAASTAPAPHIEHPVCPMMSPGIKTSSRMEIRTSSQDTWRTSSQDTLSGLLVSISIHPRPNETPCHLLAQGQTVQTPRAGKGRPSSTEMRKRGSRERRKRGSVEVRKRRSALARADRPCHRSMRRNQD